MTLIYEPKGKAGEYSKLAFSPYRGCDHLCVYCYVPLATHRTREAFENMVTRPNVLHDLEREAAKLQSQNVSGQVLMAFSCDPYGHLDETEKITRGAIEILHAHGFSICTLTKGGRRALRDLDLFREGDAFASSLTLDNEKDSREWEPGTALPYERVMVLRKFSASGLPTWVSLEPVIFPEQTLNLIERTCDTVNHYKVGTLNYHPQGKRTDWRRFAAEVVERLEKHGYTRTFEVKTVRKDERSYYVKQDLTKYLQETP